MAAGVRPTEDAQNELMSALSTLHLSGRFSDLTVVCHDKQWAVHKAIVCSRSGFFDGACSNNFREADSGVIDLSEDDQDSVEQMIHYFYYLDYMNQNERRPSPVFRHRAISDSRRRSPPRLDLSQIEDPLLAQAGCGMERPNTPPVTSFDISLQTAETKSPRASWHKHKRSLTPPTITAIMDESESSDEEELADETDCSHLLLHTRVYALAEKFDIPSLKELARSKFEMAMACHYDSPQFADAIEEVYCSTVDQDRGLRDVVLQAFRTHPQLASTKDVFEVIKATPSLAFELFKIERGIPV